MHLHKHVNRVRLLYKSCMKLHRGLPSEMRVIGDSYVREEFRRHKLATPQQAKIFMEEWTKYAISLSRQLGKREPATLLGEHLANMELDSFSDDQIAQLYELHEEIVQSKK
jgi:hypothetical protein